MTILKYHVTNELAKILIGSAKGDPRLPQVGKRRGLKKDKKSWCKYAMSRHILIVSLSVFIYQDSDSPIFSYKNQKTPRPIQVDKTGSLIGDKKTWTAKNSCHEYNISQVI